MALIFEPLGRKHPRADFNCGVPPLDDYLKVRASQDVKRRVAAVFVGIDDGTGELVGYYTLSSLSVRLGGLPADVQKKLPSYPDVSAALLGRLAVDLRHRGQGHGELLLFDALRRVWLRSQDVASFAVVVDAKDENAASFYARYGFVPFPSRPGRMFIPVDTVAKMFA